MKVSYLQKINRACLYSCLIKYQIIRHVAFTKPFVPVFNHHIPVDPGVRKRTIKFKLSVRTGNPLLWVSRNLPANEATGHTQLYNVNK